MGTRLTCVAKLFLFLLWSYFEENQIVVHGMSLEIEREKEKNETGIISFQPMFNSLCMTLGVSSTLVDGQ